MTTANQPTSLEDRYRKLLQIALFKRWNSQVFLKFWDQLEDGSDLSSDENTTATLFQAADNSYLDPLFLEYISCLALDQKVPGLTVASVIEHIRQCSLVSKHKVLIYIGKAIADLTIVPAKLNPILEAAANYLSEPDNLSILELRALAYLAEVLGKKCSNDISSAKVEKDTTIQPFRASLKKFVDVLEKKDEDLAVMLREQLALLLNADDNSIDHMRHAQKDKKPTLKLLRAFRMLYLEQLMFMSCYIQGQAFINELELLMEGEPAMVIIEELITTTFDCLAACMQRQDSQKYVNLWNGFMTKRIPLVIQHYAKDVPANQIDSVVCRPITLLDQGTISQITGGNDALDDMFSSFPSTSTDVRMHFLQECIALKIISPECLKNTLGNEAVVSENSLSSDAGTSLIPSKENPQISISISDFIAQNVSHENPDHVMYENSSLLWLLRTYYEELDGARQFLIAEELVALINEYTSPTGNDPRALARLCEVLAENVNVMDMLVLHVSPATILSPLIVYLDSWKQDDDDVANLQDCYSDLGSIFIFILQLYDRYGMTLNDITPLRATDSFCRQQIQLYFGFDGAALVLPQKSIDELSDEHRELLGGWIAALFSGDGISDDLMRMSSFKVLIDLTPIIVEQVVKACDMNMIDMELLRGGLGYFRQPVLAVAVIGALKYICQTTWDSRIITPAQQVVLQELVIIGDRSPEAIRLHNSVLAVIGKPLIRCLKGATFNTVSAHNGASDLLKKVRELTQEHIVVSKRPVAFDPASLSLISIIKDHLTGLTSWSMTVNKSQGSPPMYNLDMFTAAIKLFGAVQSARVFLEELELADSQGVLSVTLDVAVSLLLCSSDEKILQVFTDEVYLQIIKEESQKMGEKDVFSKGYNLLRKTLIDLRERFRESAIIGEPKEPEPALEKAQEADVGQNLDNGLDNQELDLNDFTFGGDDNRMDLDSGMDNNALDLNATMGDDLFGNEMDLS